MHFFFTLAVDEQRARALPQSVTDSTPMHAGPSSSIPPPDPSTKNSTKLSNSSGLADGGRKRKRSTETNVKKVQKRRGKAKNGSNAKKKPTKRRKTTADAEASATDSASEDSDSTQDEHSGEDNDEDEEGDEDEDEDGDEGEGQDENEDEDAPQTMTGKSTKKTSMDPRRWKGAKAVVDTIKVNVSTAVPSQSNNSLPSPPTAHPLPSPPVDPLVIPPRAPSMPGGLLLATSPAPAPPSNETPTSVSGAQADASWPSWFKDAHQLLPSQDLGPEFTSLINQLIKFEKLTDFAAGERSAGFRSDKRLPEVRFWISRGRTTQPKISNLANFEKNWWKWWKGLQPPWRAVFEVEGSLDRTHRPVLTCGRDWSAINKHGRNAFFSIMATLFWWGTALSKPPTEDSSWLAAVEEVAWVLDGLLGVE